MKQDYRKCVSLLELYSAPLTAIEPGTHVFSNRGAEIFRLGGAYELAPYEALYDHAAIGVRDVQALIPS